MTCRLFQLVELSATWLLTLHVLTLQHYESKYRICDLLRNVTYCFGILYNNPRY